MIVAVLAGISRYVLVPKINKSRDLMLEGEKIARKSFSSLHTVSVSINVIQIILLLVILIIGIKLNGNIKFFSK